jgi:GH24 family phage-related lysozyme (muramidase)
MKTSIINGSEVSRLSVAIHDAFSNDRKVALVDMGFNIGIPKLKSNFPNFNAAVNRGDWPTAAVESHRTGLDDSRNPRNKDTHDQLLSDK